MSQCTLEGAYQFNVTRAEQEKNRDTAEGDFSAAAMYYSAAMMANCARQPPERVVELIRASRDAQQSYRSRVGTATAPAACPVAPGAVAGAVAEGGSPVGLPDRLPATLQAPKDGDNPEIAPVIPKKIAVTLSDIAGNEDAKRIIRGVLINPFNFPQQYPSNILTDGIMFYGVAGTGKTTMAAAAAKAIVGYRTPQEVRQLRDNPRIPGFVDKYFPDGQVPRVLFFSASVSDIVSKFVGEPARKITRFFQMARETQPSILFFDEGEQYLDPGDTNNAMTIGAFKQELGGLRSKGEVRDFAIVILATNYPMRVEHSIRSRLKGGSVELSLPDFQARKQIATFNFNKGQWSTAQTQRVSPYAVSPEPLVAQPEEMAAYIACHTRPPDEQNPNRNPWSGRDIETLVKTAYMANRNRVLNGFVRKCSPCTYYPNLSLPEGASAYQEVTLDQVNETLKAQYDPNNPNQLRDLTAQEIVRVSSLSHQEQLSVLASPLTLEDFTTAFEQSGSSVDRGSIRDQMEYNQELGKVENPQGFWQRLYQGPVAEPKLLGINTTVPVHDGAECG